MIMEHSIRPVNHAVPVNDDQNFYIGLILAVSSSLFIGSSFIIKKKGLIRLTKQGHLRASDGGFGYLKDWIWWTGLICMGLGEALNFAAYAFAPASLVTPLGALSVIVAAILSSKFLNERLNVLGKMGCFLCIIGSIIIVLHSPKESTDNEDITSLFNRMRTSSFIIYCVIVMLIALTISCYCGPKYGTKNVVVYIILCSAIGSLTVMGCKVLGLAIRDSINGKSEFNSAFPYIVLLVTVSFIAIQMNYLNKSLDTFNASVVTPIYYVLFTTLVIVASSILFQEWSQMKTEDIVGEICGFLIVIAAIILLNAFKDIDIPIDELRLIVRPKRTNERLITPNYDEMTVQHSKLKSRAYGTTSVRYI